MKSPKAVRRSVVAIVISFALVLPALADMRKWVAVDDLKRRTCPSVECGVVGRFFFQETVRIFETVSGWSRVSHFKPAGCYDGESMYVEAGKAECSRENGIQQGEFAEWVQSQFLTDKQPVKRLDTHG